MKGREEKAEADNVVVTLKVTYQSVSETKAKEHEASSKENEKSCSRAKCEGGCKKTKQIQKVKAKSQAAAALKQTRQNVRHKVKNALPSSCYKRMWGFGVL